MKTIAGSVLVLGAFLCAAVSAAGLSPTGIPLGAAAFLASATTAAQEPSAAEASLSLARPARRLIQQGLRNEGFDPGDPDGLFGPRTRGAIRRWQEARRVPPTGYLTGPEAELLRVAGAVPPSAATVATAAPTVVEASVGGAAGDELNCEQWNTQEFFETATASVVTACLAAGAEVAARDDDRVTPLHWAAWSSNEPNVVDILVATGADLEARNAHDRTPLHNAAANNGNPAVLEALLAAGADLTARSAGRTPLHLAAQHNGNSAVIDALLSGGADLKTRNSDGFTAAQLATTDNRDSAVVEALRIAEANLPPTPQPNREGGTPAARATGNAQLPPEILVDRHLVRVDRLLAMDDAGAAYSVMNAIIALQQEHNLVLPDDFYYQHAHVAFADGHNERAIASVNQYLLAAGRNGAFYREALELLDSAEETIRRAEAGRRRLDAERRRVEARQRENDELARRQADAAARPFPRDRLRSGGTGPEMVTIAGGGFEYYNGYLGWRMGQNRDRLYWVQFDRPFAISRTEVTRDEFKRFVDSSRYRTEAEQEPRYGCSGRSSSGRFIGAIQKDSSLRWNRPGFAQTGTHPVTCVSIRDAMAYADWLSRETGHAYRVPSAAEWQYAARAGSSAAMLFLGSSHDHLIEDGPEMVGVGGASATVEVGGFMPNGVGLHDMHGNVSELVLACVRGRVMPGSTRFQSYGPPGRPDGSPEHPCEYFVAAFGSHYSFSAVRARPYRQHFDGKSYFHYRNSTTGVGFRVVRDLAAD